jgi:hypothetical protein
MSLTHLIRRLHFWRISGLLAADIAVFGLTDPQEAPSFMLIIGYVLLCVTIFYLVDAVLSVSRLYGVPVRHKRRVLRSTVLLISGLVALQSIGQLSTRDVIVLMPLSALLYMYLSYARGARQRQTVREQPGV